MTRRNKYRAIVLMAFFVIVTLSCTQERSPCLTPKIASLIMETIHFPKDTSTVFVDTAIPAAVLAALPPRKDSLGLVVYPQQSTFTISLSPDSTVCKWIFSTDSLYNPFDTLTFYYERHLQFLSNACGYTYFYGLDSVHTTHQIIDSVHILNTSVTNNVNTKHLQIYIHHNF